MRLGLLGAIAMPIRPRLERVSLVPMPETLIKRLTPNSCMAGTMLIVACVRTCSWELSFAPSASSTTSCPLTTRLTSIAFVMSPTITSSCG